MEITLIFGALWVLFALLIIMLRDKLAALALLGFNLTIAGFFLIESDVAGAVVKLVLGSISALIVFLAASRTRAPRARMSVRVLSLTVVFTLVLSYLVAFLLQPQFPAEHNLESYFLIVLFGLGLLAILSQKSVLKLLLGILIFENIGALVLAWAPNAAVFAVATELLIVVITITIALIATMDFAEYDTIDTSKMTKLRG